MAIFITNDDVRKLLPMDECVAVLEDMFRQEAAGLVENLARRRFRVAGTSAPPGPPANLMGGVVAGSHAYGTRHNSVTLLHNTDTNKLEAVLEPGAIATHPHRRGHRRRREVHVAPGRQHRRRHRHRTAVRHPDRRDSRRTRPQANQGLQPQRRQAPSVRRGDQQAPRHRSRPGVIRRRSRQGLAHRRRHDHQRASPCSTAPRSTPARTSQPSAPTAGPSAKSTKRRSSAPTSSPSTTSSRRRSNAAS